MWINVGTRHEKDSICGISHFIEHMLFKGTKNRTAKDISNDIEYYGGQINAHTSHDHTCFYVKLPYYQLENGIDVLSDILLNSVFDEEAIEKEKSVIIEEIKMSDDSAGEFLYETLLKKTFSNKGIGRNILGSIDSVNSINKESIKKYFKNHYIPERAVVVATGKFDFEKLCDIVERKFSTWENEGGIKNPEVESQTFNPCVYVRNKSDEQVNIAIITQCPDDSNIKDFYATRLLNIIFGSTSSSRLFQNIREDRGLCYSIYTDTNYYVGYGEFGIYTSVARSNTKLVLDLLIEEIKKLKKDYITKEELDFAKEKCKGSLMLNMEDSSDIMMTIGEYEVVDERMPKFEDIVSVIDSIDIDYVNGIIDMVFNEKISIGVIGKNVKKLINEEDYINIWR